MTFSVSHIAWAQEEEPEAMSLLNGLNIPLIEVAPGRMWNGNPIGSGEPESLRSIWNAGLGIAGFQAILFGKPELRLFEKTSQKNLLEYLKQLTEACSSVRGRYLVFGAPKNRWIPEEMNQAQAFELAIDFFRDLGAHAAKHGVVIGMEANPTSYGCNFCTHADDVVRLVRAVDSPGMGWHLDTGELAMNNETLPAVILDNADLICSVHVSEPNLGDFEIPWNGHDAVSAALREISYSGIVSLEMKRPASGLNGVRTAAKRMIELYS